MRWNSEDDLSIETANTSTENLFGQITTAKKVDSIRNWSISYINRTDYYTYVICVVSRFFHSVVFPFSVDGLKNYTRDVKKLPGVNWLKMLIEA